MRESGERNYQMIEKSQLVGNKYCTDSIVWTQHTIYNKITDHTKYTTIYLSWSHNKEMQYTTVPTQILLPDLPFIWTSKTLI